MIYKKSNGLEPNAIAEKYIIDPFIYNAYLHYLISELEVFDNLLR